MSTTGASVTVTIGVLVLVVGPIEDRAQLQALAILVATGD